MTKKVREAREHEKQYLQDNYQSKRVLYMAAYLGVSNSYVSVWLNRMGHSKSRIKDIPDDKKVFLVNNYNNMKKKELAEELDVPVNKISSWARRLGLYKTEMREYDYDNRDGFFEHDENLVTI